jgi:UDP-N-acetylglucosamine transferase subunit ALG13
VKVIHIETFSHVNRLTKLGRFLAAIKYPITSQWPGNCGDNVTYIGPILMGKEGEEAGTRESRHVFVTLGTREEPFPRLLGAVEALVKDGTIKERVIAQAGSTSYRSEVLEIFAFQSPAAIDDLIMNASYVITQESAGIGTKCLRYHKRMIVMPRDYALGELPAQSDMNEDLHLRLQELGYAFVAQDVAELKNAIENIQKLKVGFPFDNTPAIAKLRALIEAS